MLFDSSLLFFHATTVYNFTSGEFVSLVGVTSSCTSTAINLGNARDLGIGNGAEIPYVALNVGTAVTSSCASMLINAQFQGSTNGISYTTYAETGPLATSSFTAGATVLPIAVPRRPNGIGLPLYYRVNLALTGNAASESVSTGSIIGGIVLARSDSANTLDQYPAGFTVA